MIEELFDGFYWDERLQDKDVYWASNKLFNEGRWREGAKYHLGKKVNTDDGIIFIDNLLQEIYENLEIGCHCDFVRAISFLSTYLNVLSCNGVANFNTSKMKVV